MAQQAVIVALPPALDPVRLVGDEEKHATILYFGDTASLPADAKTTILESLATVANLFMPFAEETIGVERLGSDVPPALVAKLSNRCLGKIRDTFQVNPSIVSYMSNGTQYPQYTPHVTLGYPDFQAEVGLKELTKTLYEIRFDRLALWWDDERIEFPLGAQDRGMMRALSQDAMAKVGDFLEHHGIKGMKWGVRRKDPSGSGSSGSSDKSSDDKSTKKAMDKMAVGSVVPMKQSDGTTKLLIKKKDGSWKETYVSADAEKFIRATQKEGHEISDRELRETVQRAKMVKEYDQWFGDGPNKELQQRVEQMRLQKEYKQLNTELNPPKKSMVKKFVAASEAGFNAYQKIDQISGGAVSKKVKMNMNAALFPPTNNSAPKSKPFAGPGPKTKGFRGKTPPPAPWGSGSPAGAHMPGGARIKPNPNFKPRSSQQPVPNISTIGHMPNNFKNSDGSFRPGMFIRPDGSAFPVRTPADLPKALPRGS